MAEWRSPDALHNATALRANAPDVFVALAEIDSLGHRVLHRASVSRVADLDHLVGISFLRRSATLFSGARALIEASSIEVAKLTARAQFELLLASRYLVHGASRRVDFRTTSSTRARTARSNYFVAAGIRAKIYRRQATIDGVYGRRPDSAARARLQAEIDEHIHRLKEHFPRQHKRFGPLRCFGPRDKRRYFDNKEWYSPGFRRNVNSARALAYSLGFGKSYEMLYAAYSALVHTKGYDQDLTIEDDRAEVYSPHMAEAFDTLCYYSISYTRLTLTWLSKVYSPESAPDVSSTGAKVSALVSGLSSDLPAGFIE